MTELEKERAEIKIELAKEQLSAMVDREGGLTELVFEVCLTPTMLPENTPADIVSAWIRLQHAAKDLELIERWLDRE